MWWSKQEEPTELSGQFSGELARRDASAPTPPIGMGPSERYLLDMNGYLHLRGVLAGDELAAARDAVVTYAEADPSQLPPPFDRIRRENDADVYPTDRVNIASHLSHAFAFDKSLERIIFHERVWPIVMELTGGSPRLGGGVLLCEDHRPGGAGERPVHLHCAREDGGPRKGLYEVRNGRVLCDHFIVFPYFDDVLPGDGGLLVLPGSHKSLFERPPELYGKFGEAARRATRQDQYPETGRFGEFTGPRWREVFDYDGILPEESLDHGMKAICPKAGDVLIMPEALTHGVLPWLPTDRARYAMLMSVSPSHRGGGGDKELPNNTNLPPEIFELLSPETQELVQFGDGEGVKSIAASAVAPRLSDVAPAKL